MTTATLSKEVTVRDLETGTECSVPIDDLNGEVTVEKILSAAGKQGSTAVLNGRPLVGGENVLPGEKLDVISKIANG